VFCGAYATSGREQSAVDTGPSARLLSGFRQRRCSPRRCALHVDDVEHVDQYHTWADVERIGRVWCVGWDVDVVVDYVLRWYVHDDDDDDDDHRRGLGWWRHDDDGQQLDDATSERVLSVEPE